MYWCIEGGSSFSLKNRHNLRCFDIMSLLNVYRLCHRPKPVWSVSQKSAQSWMFSFDIMSLLYICIYRLCHRPKPNSSKLFEYWIKWNLIYSPIYNLWWSIKSISLLSLSLSLFQVLSSNVSTPPTTFWFDKGLSKYYVKTFLKLTPIESFYVVHNSTLTNVTSACEDTKIKTFFPPKIHTNTASLFSNIKPLFLFFIVL